MPKLAAFPKAYIKELCDGSMQLSKWIDLASELDIDGLEWYAGFHEMKDKKIGNESANRSKIKV